LDLLEVHRAGFNPLTVGLEALRRDVELVSDIGDHLPWSGVEVMWDKPEIAQRTELEGKAQAGIVLALVVDRRLLRV